MSVIADHQGYGFLALAEFDFDHRGGMTIELSVLDLFERLPGFPDGADAIVNITTHAAAVPTKSPDFFLATSVKSDDAGLGDGMYCSAASWCPTVLLRDD